MRLNTETSLRAFIVGMPRSGTTYLSNTMNHHSQVASYGESLFWGRGYVKPDKAGTYSESQLESIKEQFKNNHWLPPLDEERKKHFEKLIDKKFTSIQPKQASPKTVFDVLAEVFLEIDKKQIFIEKTPHHIQWIERILSFYPNAKFIVAIRDPYDFMLSYKFQGSQKNGEIRSVFKSVYHPISCSLVWKKNYRAYKKAKDKYPDKVFKVSTKHLLSNDAMLEILEFLGLSKENIHATDIINSSFEKVHQKPELDATDYFWMNFLCRQQFLEMDTKVIQPRISVFEFLSSVIEIPKILFRLLRVLKVGKGQSKLKYILNYLKK